MKKKPFLAYVFCWLSIALLFSGIMSERFQKIVCFVFSGIAFVATIVVIAKNKR